MYGFGADQEWNHDEGSLTVVCSRCGISRRGNNNCICVKFAFFKKWRNYSFFSHNLNGAKKWVPYNHTPIIISIRSIKHTHHAFQPLLRRRSICPWPTHRRQFRVQADVRPLIMVDGALSLRHNCYLMAWSSTKYGEGSWNWNNGCVCKEKDV